MTAPRNPIEFELFKNAMLAIADEMALTIVRTAYSGVLKDNMDFSTALIDASGQLVAQGLTMPGHLGSMPTAIAAVLARFGDDLHPGDIVALNDPYEGGMHLPDIFLFKPVFAEDGLIAFAATVCHHTDVGGRVPGSNASDSTEIYQEGLRIAPIKLQDRGRRNETLMLLIERNVRVPARVFGDLRAQLSACHVADLKLLDLVAHYGAADVRAHMADMLDYSERITRAGLAELPDGVFTFEDFIDDDGIDIGQTIRLFVTITKSGDTIALDWTGSAPQVRGAINNTLSFTKAASYAAVMSVLPAEVVPNAGAFRAINVMAPSGSIANAVLPAACAARGLTGFRMVDCALGALAMMLPDRVFAACEGGNTGITIGGYDAERRPFIYVDFACGAWGGRPWADGLDGNANLFANMASHSVELTEGEQPILIEAYEFLADRAGPGKFRGGVPYRRDYRLCEAEAILQVRADRHTVLPYGLYGGGPGAPSRNYLNPDREDGRELTSKPTLAIRRGDLFRHELAGGGGWGDPLERDPASVLADVRNELVSEAHAREAYGVVVDMPCWQIDMPATERLRDKMRQARGGAQLPAMSRTAPGGRP